MLCRYGRSVKLTGWICLARLALRSGQSQKAIKCCQKLCKHENCQNATQTRFQIQTQSQAPSLTEQNRAGDWHRKRESVCEWEGKGKGVGAVAVARWESSRLRTIVCVVQVSTAFAIPLNFYLFGVLSTLRLATVVVNTLLLTASSS